MYTASRLLTCALAVVLGEGASAQREPDRDFLSTTHPGLAAVASYRSASSAAGTELNYVVCNQSSNPNGLLVDWELVGFATGLQEPIPVRQCAFYSRSAKKNTPEHAPVRYGQSGEQTHSAEAFIAANERQASGVADLKIAITRLGRIAYSGADRLRERPEFYTVELIVQKLANRELEHRLSARKPSVVALLWLPTADPKEVAAIKEELKRSQPTQEVMEGKYAAKYVSEKDLPLLTDAMKAGSFIPVNVSSVSEAKFMYTIRPGFAASADLLVVGEMQRVLYRSLYSIAH